ncbi:hypothetical protein [Nostoc sp.]|uniref:hypothetical protein n=1 Tax=Nostoc sp. TaxID=1180 RepID=UPI003FA5F072
MTSKQAIASHYSRAMATPTLGIPRERIWLVETGRDILQTNIAGFSPREGIWLVETYKEGIREKVRSLVSVPVRGFG